MVQLLHRWKGQRRKRVSRDSCSVVVSSQWLTQCNQVVVECDRLRSKALRSTTLRDSPGRFGQFNLPLSRFSPRGRPGPWRHSGHRHCTLRHQLITFPTRHEKLDIRHENNVFSFSCHVGNVIFTVHVGYWVWRKGSKASQVSGPATASRPAPP